MFATTLAYINGIVVSVGFIFFVVFSIPIYLYRFILQHVVVPLYSRENVVQPVAAASTMFATEFLSNNFPPRCSIVTCFVIEGHMPFSEVEEEIKRKWIFDKEARYPELQQYIESWMGFLFWHKDTTFELSNHLYREKIPDGGGSASSEKWICSKIEELLNKPFPLKRSHWEVHVIENYINTELLPTGSRKDTPLTAFVMRFHHGLADGFSILYAVIEGLFGTSLSKLAMATATSSSMRSASAAGAVANQNVFEFAKKVIYDVGSFGSLVIRPKTQWHVSDNRKRWKQLYARSKLIPIERVKQIKNKFGASFTGVIFACISAGVSKSIHGGGNVNKRVDYMPTMTVLPVPGHSSSLSNHAKYTQSYALPLFRAAAIFDLPTDSSLDPVTRLRKCEECLQLAKQSTIPFFGVLVTKLVGCHLASVAKFLLANRSLAIGLSNFPGPGKTIEWNGRKGLSTDFIAGALNGVAGAGFMVLSYRNSIRIAATVENAVMDKEGLELLIHNICQEMKFLERTN